MNKTTLATGLLAVPGVSAGIDLLRSADIGSTIGEVAGSIDGVLEIGNSMLNPLFSTVVGGASAGLLTNSVLKEFDWMKEHEKTRWLLSIAAGGMGYAAGTAAAPFLAAGGLAYALGKPTWKYGKELVKRLGKTVGGAVSETANSSINLLTAPLRGIYSGLIKDTLLMPSPVRAVTQSISN